MTTEATTVAAPPSEGPGTQTDAAAPAAPETIEAAKPEGTPPATTQEVAYDFKAPEGVELDTDLVGKFTDIAKEMKLPGEQAQKVVDLYASVRKAEAEAFVQQVKDWGEAVKVDKEIGGDKLPENLAAARKVIDTFGSEDFRSLLDSTGLGNHPEVVRTLVKIGKAISEDGFVKGAPKPAQAKSFYENSNMS